MIDDWNSREKESSGTFFQTPDGWLTKLHECSDPLYHNVFKLVGNTGDINKLPSPQA